VFYGQPVYFAINQTSGEITTTAVLDRESFGSKYLFFTVKLYIINFHIVFSHP
jgi:hypothetical protein